MVDRAGCRGRGQRARSAPACAGAHRPTGWPAPGPHRARLGTNTRTMTSRRPPPPDCCPYPCPYCTLPLLTTAKPLSTCTLRRATCALRRAPGDPRAAPRGSPCGRAARCRCTPRASSRRRRPAAPPRRRRRPRARAAAPRPPKTRRRPRRGARCGRRTAIVPWERRRSSPRPARAAPGCWSHFCLPAGAAWPRACQRRHGGAPTRGDARRRRRRR
jgi:hypothetical protein